MNKISGVVCIHIIYSFKDKKNKIIYKRPETSYPSSSDGCAIRTMNYYGHAGEIFMHFVQHLLVRRPVKVPIWIFILLFESFSLDKVCLRCVCQVCAIHDNFQLENIQNKFASRAAAKSGFRLRHIHPPRRGQLLKLGAKFIVAG